VVNIILVQFVQVTVNYVDHDDIYQWQAIFSDVIGTRLRSKWGGALNVSNGRHCIEYVSNLQLSSLSDSDPLLVDVMVYLGYETYVDTM
jgi:hypothetical protein